MMIITWLLLIFATSSSIGQVSEPKSARKLLLGNEFEDNGPNGGSYVNNIVEESSNFIIKNSKIEQWHRLHVHKVLYLLGVAPRKISLVSLLLINSNKYQVLEYLMDVPYNVASAVMFNSRIPRDGELAYSGIVLLGLMSPTPTVDVFEIKNFKLVKVTSWKFERPVQAVAHFDINDDNRVIIIEDWDTYSHVNVYALRFEKPTPHYWHLETLVVDKIHKQPSIERLKHGIFMALIKSKDRSVEVYSYKHQCDSSPQVVSGGRFELVATRPAQKAKRVRFFHARGLDYFLLITEISELFVITLDGSFHKVFSFPQAEDMMFVPVSEDWVIMMGKSSTGEPLFYTNDPINNGWLLLPTPKCQRSKWSDHGAHSLYDLNVCIGGNRSWEGATYLIGEGYPSILFADRKVPGELYHLIFASAIGTGSSSSNAYFADELEFILNRLRSVINQVSGRTSVDDTQLKAACSVHDDLQQALTDTRNHLSNLCMLEKPQLRYNDHTIVLDESKPHETITRPTKIISDATLPSQDLTIAGSEESSVTTASEAFNNVINYRPSTSHLNTPISPDMNTNNLPEDNRHNIVDRLGGQVMDSIYQ